MPVRRASVQHADAQPARVGADLLGVRPVGRRRRVRVAGRGPSTCVEDGGGVAHRAGHGQLADEAAATSPSSGARETRPRLGFSPTRPHSLAGMRIDPPPSLAWPIGTIPAATAAADPPLDPPVERVVSQGLRVGP